MKVAYSRRDLATRVADLGRTISRDYQGRTLDVVAILENSFLFSADLVRQISCPVVCHFVRTELRAVEVGGSQWPELFFSTPPTLEGRDVLVVDAILHTGVPQDFLWKRLEECKPRSLSLAVLFDKEKDHKVSLKATYVGFASASKYWVGYGLAGRDGLYRNLPYIATVSAADNGGSRAPRLANALKSTKRKIADPKRHKPKHKAG
ncbi:MAG TPA: phosphoribosyltransferase family protein [Candidatus Acidoferrales bacterium]|nr:phosphoribosyltransferase family protein [Candidatus Acidoferrales bacterium]